MAPLNPFTAALVRLAEPRRVVPVLLAAIAAVVIAGGLSWRSLAAVCLVAITWSFAYLDARDRRRVADELAMVHDQLAETARREQQRADDIGRLAELSQLLQTCDLPEEAYRVIERAAPALVGRPGSLFLIDNAPRVEQRAIWGSWEGGREEFDTGQCWALRRSRLHDAAADSSAQRCAHLSGDTAAHSTCIPLVAQGEPIGVMTLGRPTAAAVLTAEAGDREDHLRLLTAVSEQIALALSNLRLRDTLKNQSIRDPLTGLFNRRFLEESLDRECRRSVRANRPLSVLMLDIDYFKQFNDTWGHDAGDAVLREVGSVTRSLFRGEDVACRYGGEEFALVLADTTADGALQRANELRDRVREISMTFRRQTLGPLSVSVGIATLPTHGIDGASLLHSADLALYRAKREGRDRVVIADLPEPSSVGSAEAGLS